MQGQAREQAWSAAYDMAWEKARWTWTNALDIERLTLLARARRETIDQILAAPGWLAMEAVTRMEEAVLASGPRAWRPWFINKWRAALGLTPEEDADRCHRALAHWRWEGVTPPGMALALTVRGRRFALTANGRMQCACNGGGEDGGETSRETARSEARRR